MPKPPRKPARPVSSRATVARPPSSGIGLSAADVRWALTRPLTATELAQQAQEKRYQQIIRSGKAFARQLPVVQQDGPIAYHAQARARAELKYRAQTNAWQAREQAAAQYFAAKQTYITQGRNMSASEIAERSRQTNLMIAHQKYIEHIRATNSQEIANSILHDVVLQNVAQSGLVVLGPEMSAARLAGTARWLGATRTAIVLERLGAGMTYSGNPMTLAGAGNAAAVFGKRAFVDGLLQYAGATIVNGAKQWDKGGVDIKQLLVEPTSGINATSIAMAGMPGDYLRHSIRNALVANAFEVSRDPKTGWGYKHVGLNWNSGLNYMQKVGLSVGADYLAGRFAGGLQGVRRRDSFIGTFAVGDQHLYALWRQRLWLVTQAEAIGVNSLKVTGGVSGALIENTYFTPTNAQPVP